MTATTKAPVLGLAEAAKACGISVSTLRRKREELTAYGATATDKGWRIPVTALIAMQLMPPTTPPANDTHQQPPSPGTPNDALTAEVEALRSRLADAEKRAAVAEERAAGVQALVAAHERIIETQAMALRMLEAGASNPAAVTAPMAPPANVTAPVENRLDSPVNPIPDATRDRPEPAPLWRRLLNRR